MNNSTKMKNIVLIVDSLMGGGAERVNVSLAKMFIENGFNVYLIIIKDVIHIDVDSSINIIKLGYLKNEYLLFNDYFYSIKLKKALFDIEQKNGHLDLILGSLGLTHKLMNMIGDDRFFYALHGTTTKAKLDTKNGISKFFKKYELFRTYNDKNIICVSKGVKEDILSLGIRPKSIRVIYNPFDFDEIRSKSLEKIAFDFPDKYIVHVGRFSKIKRHDILIKAFSLIDDNTLKLVLVGDGEEKDNIIQLIGELGLGNRVVLAGFQRNPYPIIKNAKALVLSSESEGLPTVIIEALVLHTVVVSTDCMSGPREILGGCLFDSLVKVNDIDNLSKMIEYVVNNNADINFKEMIDKFSKKSIMQSYMKILNNEGI
jgi:glycosyltransferase involved in cell wall biosynthesis